MEQRERPPEIEHGTHYDPALENTAIIPIGKIEDDFYDWWARHHAVLKLRHEVNSDVVLIGDSITHLWGGVPETPGEPARGAAAFTRTFAGMRVLNLGFGYDRTQNVLWRLDHGEFSDLRPKFVVLNIGTNNLVATPRARANTPVETAAGVREILARIRAGSPDSRIILMGVFPRRESPSDPLRAKIAELNTLLSALSDPPHLSFIDLKTQFLSPDGTISREIMNDFIHPTELGYRIWGEALTAAFKAIPSPSPKNNLLENNLR